MTEPALALATPIATAKATAKDWREEASRRRQISTHDPAAEALEYCASELLERLKPFDDPTSLLSVDAYASLHDKTPQTIRNWIRKGELEAREGARGWLIPRSAKRRIRRAKR